MLALLGDYPGSGQVATSTLRMRGWVVAHGWNIDYGCRPRPVMEVRRRSSGWRVEPVASEIGRRKHTVGS